MGVGVEVPGGFRIVFHPVPGPFLHPAGRVTGLRDLVDLFPQSAHLRYAIQANDLAELARGHLPQSFRTPNPGQRHETEHQDDVERAVESLPFGQQSRALGAFVRSHDPWLRRRRLPIEGTRPAGPLVRHCPSQFISVRCGMPRPRSNSQALT